MCAWVLAARVRESQVFDSRTMRQPFRNFSRTTLALVLGCALVQTVSSKTPNASSLAEQLAQAAPKLDRHVLDLAIHALGCHPQPDAPHALGVIDYSLPSTQPRLWVFDLENAALLFEERVAHGRNSGSDLTEKFSNAEGSHMSSLGAFVTGSTYMGGNGYSLRLTGLEPGFNDNAMSRAIVIHGAPYVNEAIVKAQGRLGRSWGCPAVRREIAKPLIDTIRNGAFLFSYYPDENWLAASKLLAPGCGQSAGGKPGLRGG